MEFITVLCLLRMQACTLPKSTDNVNLKDDDMHAYSDKNRLILELENRNITHEIINSNESEQDIQNLYNYKEVSINSPKKLSENILSEITKIEISIFQPEISNKYLNIFDNNKGNRIAQPAVVILQSLLYRHDEKSQVIKNEDKKGYQFFISEDNKQNNNLNDKDRTRINETWNLGNIYLNGKIESDTSYKGVENKENFVTDYSETKDDNLDSVTHYNFKDYGYKKFPMQPNVQWFWPYIHLHPILPLNFRKPFSRTPLKRSLTSSNSKYLALPIYRQFPHSIATSDLHGSYALASSYPFGINNEDQDEEEGGEEGEEEEGEGEEEEGEGEEDGGIGEEEEGADDRGIGEEEEETQDELLHRGGEGEGIGGEEEVTEEEVDIGGNGEGMGEPEDGISGDEEGIGEKEEGIEQTGGNKGGTEEEVVEIGRDGEGTPEEDKGMEEEVKKEEGIYEEKRGIDEEGKEKEVIEKAAI